MNIQSTIQIRVEENIKEKASNALKAMGLDLSSGIKLFLNEIILSEVLPFTPASKKGKELINYKIFKKEITEAKKNNKRYSTGKELMSDLLKD